MPRCRPPAALGSWQERRRQRRAAAKASKAAAAALVATSANSGVRARAHEIGEIVRSVVRARAAAVVALAVSLWRGFVGWARKAYGDWEKSITSMNEKTPTAAGA